MTEHEHMTKEELDKYLNCILYCDQCQELLANWVASHIREIFCYPGESIGH